MKKSKNNPYIDHELEKQYLEAISDNEILPIDPELESQYIEAFNNHNDYDIPSDVVNTPDIYPKLYYHEMGGIGTITCNDCGYSENIVDRIHGSYYHKAGTWEDIGYQCQSCGKFHTMDIHSENLVCSCGGKLSREEPVFCPKCKPYRMSYKKDFMTLKLI